MEDSNELIIIPTEFRKGLDYFDKLKETKFADLLGTLDNYEKQFERSISFKDVVDDESVVTKVTDELYTELNNLFMAITYEKFEEATKEKAKKFALEDKVPFDDVGSEFFVKNLEEFKKNNDDLTKNGHGYYKKKDEKVGIYEFFGKWKDNAHEEGVLLKALDSQKEVYLGKFDAIKGDYGLKGQMIQFDEKEKTVGLIIGESSTNGENINGLYIFYEKKKKVL